MSTQNVETVRNSYDAFGRGDLQAVGATFGDDVEWLTSDSLPLGGLVRGRDAVLGNFAQIPQYWNHFEVRPEEYIDGGEEWVVVRGTQRATAKSGRSIEAPFVHLVKFSGGKVLRGEFYADTAKAAEALQG